MSSVPVTFKVGPRKLRECLIECFMSGVVPHVVSSPGMGKSSIAHQTAKELRLFVIDHRLSTSQPEDLSGLPRFDTDGLARFSPFADLFPLDQGSDEANALVIPEGYDGWLLLLDEINSAPRSVIAAAYKLILDRMVGQHKLHPNVLIMTAGNHLTDRAIADQMGTAMQSRLLHLELEIVFDDWLEDVALAHNWDPRIIGYLSQYKSQLLMFDPKHTDRTFPCPRTWEITNKLTYRGQVQQPLEGKDALIAGAVGSAASISFLKFCEIYKDVVKLQDVLDDPDTCPLPTTTDMRWATITMLLEHIGDTPEYTQICTYANRFTMDFKVLFYRAVLVRQPGLRRHKMTIKGMSEVSQYLHRQNAP